jgi:hypothetical protein
MKKTKFTEEQIAFALRNLVNLRGGAYYYNRQKGHHLF